MKKQNSILTTLPVLFGFFVMGFCDIVGISSDYVQRSFNWSPVMTGFVPSMVFIWFLFLSIPIGNQMNKWGREFEVDKSRWQTYAKDYFVAMATAAMPWFLIAIYYIFVLLPPEYWNSWEAWKENLLLSQIGRAHV